MAERSTGFPERCEPAAKDDANRPRDGSDQPATAAKQHAGGGRSVSPWNKKAYADKAESEAGEKRGVHAPLAFTPAEDRKTKWFAGNDNGAQPRGTTCSAQCTVPCPMRKKKIR